MTANSAVIQRGGPLDQIIKQPVGAFQKELEEDGAPLAALVRLSEDDAVRIFSIHKCKGLEFDKVVVFGVEEELFRGDDKRAELFVAISRAKQELILTWTKNRPRPGAASGYWDVVRHAQHEFLNYAVE